MGARISSDSWIVIGAAAGASDDVYALGFDTFAWQNPGFISLVAAGNFGERQKDSSTYPIAIRGAMMLYGFMALLSSGSG